MLKPCEPLLPPFRMDPKANLDYLPNAVYTRINEGTKRDKKKDELPPDYPVQSLHLLLLATYKHEWK